MVRVLLLDFRLLVLSVESVLLSWGSEEKVRFSTCCLRQHGVLELSKQEWCKRKSRINEETFCPSTEAQFQNNCFQTPSSPLLSVYHLRWWSKSGDQRGDKVKPWQNPDAGERGREGRSDNNWLMSENWRGFKVEELLPLQKNWGRNWLLIKRVRAESNWTRLSCTVTN